MSNRKRLLAWQPEYLILCRTGLVHLGREDRPKYTEKRWWSARLGTDSHPGLWSVIQFDAGRPTWRTSLKKMKAVDKRETTPPTPPLSSKPKDRTSPKILLLISKGFFTTPGTVFLVQYFQYFPFSADSWFQYQKFQHLLGYFFGSLVLWCGTWNVFFVDWLCK